MITNKGKVHFGSIARSGGPPTNYYIALVTSAVALVVDINALSELTEIAAGNGYTTGGYQLDPNTTDFNQLNENDTLDRAELYIKNLTWSASGGNIPDSGNVYRYAILRTIM